MFYLVENESDDGIAMFADYVIDVENSLESKFLIKSLTRFSSAFQYCLTTLDEDDYYFS